jgi:hypothetical protein
MTTHLRWTVVLVTAIVVAAPAARAFAQGKAESQRSRLPAAVARVVDASQPGAEIDKLEVEKEEGITVYDFEFKAGRGEMDVAEDGTVLDVSTLVQMKDVPEAAAAVIQRAARGTTIKQLTKSEVRARIEKQGGKGRITILAAPEYVYEAELARGGEVEVAAEGRIIKAPKSMGKASPEK